MASSESKLHDAVAHRLDNEEPQGGHGKSTARVYKKSASAKAGRIRKSPDAPKRFKSSYILFFMAKQAEIKNALGEAANVSAVSKKSSEEWKHLSPEERAVWEEKAAEDKARYNIEKLQYTGPWQVPWKRRKKDPSAPKRPMSAFLFFTQKKRSEIQAANPTLKNTEVSRMLGDIWRKMTLEQKAPHLEVERIARENYKAALAEWKEQLQEQQEDKIGKHIVGVATRSLVAADCLGMNSGTRTQHTHGRYSMNQTHCDLTHSHIVDSGANPSCLAQGLRDPLLSLPTTGIFLGAAGVPLLPTPQPPMIFDDDFDFVGEEIDNDTG